MHCTDSNHQLSLLKWSLHGLGALVALGIVLAAVLGVYRPVHRQAEAYLWQTARLQKLLKSEDRVRVERGRLQDTLAAGREQAGKLQSRIPDEPQEADFLAQASQLAEQVGLTLRDYRRGQVTTHASYSAMRVELICEGDYGSLCRFMDELTELPRHSTVVHLRITGDGEQNWYAAEMSLELYFAAKGRMANRQPREDPHA